LGSPGGRHVLMTAWWYPKKTKNFREQYKMIVWSRMMYKYIYI
jgi:ribosomal protein S10